MQYLQNPNTGRRRRRGGKTRGERPQPRSKPSPRGREGQGDRGGEGRGGSKKRGGPTQGGPPNPEEGQGRRGKPHHPVITEMEV